MILTHRIMYECLNKQSHFSNQNSDINNYNLADKEKNSYESERLYNDKILNKEKDDFSSDDSFKKDSYFTEIALENEFSFDDDSLFNPCKSLKIKKSTNLSNYEFKFCYPQWYLDDDETVSITNSVKTTNRHITYNKSEHPSKMELSQSNGVLFQKNILSFKLNIENKSIENKLNIDNPRTTENFKFLNKKFINNDCQRKNNDDHLMKDGLISTLLTKKTKSKIKNSNEINMKIKFKADFFYIKRNYELAFEYYTEHQENLNSTHDSILWRACEEDIIRCYIKLNKLEEAIQRANYLMLTSSNVEHLTSSLNLLLKLHSMTQNMNDHIISIKNFILLQPSSPFHWLNLGNALENSKSSSLEEEAWKCFIMAKYLITKNHTSAYQHSYLSTIFQSMNQQINDKKSKMESQFKILDQLERIMISKLEEQKLDFASNSISIAKLIQLIENQKSNKIFNEKWLSIQE